MNMRTFFRVTLLLLAIGLVAAGASQALAAGETTDAIAGTWYGNMHFSTDPHVERIKFTILAGCEPGSVCGTLLNYPQQCVWEVTYDGASSDTYNYHFSNTLKGGCPSGSTGSVQLLADGSLYRVHTTPFFTSSGILKQRPNADGD